MTQFHSTKFQFPFKKEIKLLKTIFSLLCQRSTIINPSILLAKFEDAMSFVGQVSVKKGLIVEIHISYVL